MSLRELREYWAAEIEARDRRRRRFVWLAELEEAFLDDARAELEDIDGILEQRQQEAA